MVKVAKAMNAFFLINMPVNTPCTTLNAATVNTKNDICCDVVSAFAYHSFGWLVFGIVSALFGVPVTILAFKRLPNQIWVSVYIRTVRRRVIVI